MKEQETPLNTTHQILLEYGCAVPTSTLLIELKHRDFFNPKETLKQQIAYLRKSGVGLYYCRYSGQKGWRLSTQN